MGLVTEAVHFSWSAFAGTGLPQTNHFCLRILARVFPSKIPGSLIRTTLHTRKQTSRRTITGASLCTRNPRNSFNHDLNEIFEPFQSPLPDTTVPANSELEEL